MTNMYCSNMIAIASCFSERLYLAHTWWVRYCELQVWRLPKNGKSGVLYRREKFCRRMQSLVYCTARKNSCQRLKGTQDWDFFWLRFWNLHYFFISYVKILRFYKKNFLIRPLFGEIRFFRLVCVPHADDNRIGPCRVQQQRGSRDHQYQ